MRKVLTLSIVSCIFSASVAAQQPATPPPSQSDPTRASILTASDLQTALSKLSTDRPGASVRVFSLAPYNVNVERRLAKPQGASLHETQAELFYVIDGAATLLTGGRLIDETRNGNNLSGKGIEGGTAQKFGKGDFLLVPSGVAHQFVDIENPVVLMSIYLPHQR